MKSISNNENHQQINTLGKGRYGELVLIEKGSNRYIKEIFDNNSILLPEIDLISQINHPACLKIKEYEYPDHQKAKSGYLIYEYMQNGNLEQAIRSGKIRINDLTSLMIILYGIADCMEYISNQNLCCDFNLSNIFLDDKLEPHLTGFYVSRPSDFEATINSSIPRGLHNYNVPIILQSQHDDSYNYGKLICSIFSSNSDKIELKDIPDFLKTIVEKCIDEDPTVRPSFGFICNFLQNINEVDKCKYNNYINFIKENRKRSDYIKKDNKFNIPDYIKEYVEAVKPIKDFSDSKHKKNNDPRLGGASGMVEEVNYPKGTPYSVALKKILYVVGNQTDSIKLFFRETDIMHQVSHPCTLTLIAYDIYHNRKSRKSGPSYDKSYIAMNYCEHLSLAHNLTPNGNDIKNPRINKFSNFVRGNPTICMIIAYGIARGLAYLHFQNIKHRDIKPENILIDHNLHPHIADFGFAKKSKDDVNSDLYGTESYIAPEMAYSHVNYTYKSDVYSLGLVFYEIFERQRYFYAINYMTRFNPDFDPADYRMRPLKDEIKRERQKANNSVYPEFEFTPKNIQEEIKKMLAYDLKERPEMRDICIFFENPENWLEGTDPKAFYEYKRLIDASEKELVDRYFRMTYYSMDKYALNYSNQVCDIESTKARQIKYYENLLQLRSYQEGEKVHEYDVCAASALALAHIYGTKEIPKDCVIAFKFLQEAKIINEKDRNVMIYHDLLVKEIQKFENKNEIKLNDSIETFQSINGLLLMGMYMEAKGEFDKALKFYLKSALRGSDEANGRAAIILLVRKHNVHFAEKMLLSIKPWENLNSSEMLNFFVSKSDECKICLYYLGLIKMMKSEIDKAIQIFNKLFCLGFPNVDSFLTICFYLQNNAINH